MAQSSIDFVRKSQLAAIRECVLPSCLCSDGKTVSAAAMKSVLMAIDSRAGKEGSYFASLNTLRQDTGLGRRTVARALEGLRSLSLIVEWFDPEVSQRRHRRIAFSNLEDFRPGGTSATIAPTSATRTPTGATITTTGATVAPKGNRKGTLSEQKPSPPSPPSHPPTPERRPSGVSWERIEEELSSRGIQEFDSAVATARRNVSAAHVLELITWFDRHATARGLTAGALYLRVCKARDWLAIEERWPHADTIQPRDRRQEDQARREKEQRREKELGPELDRMSDRELLTLAAEESPTLASLVRLDLRTARRDADTRRRLLITLESRSLADAS